MRKGAPKGNQNAKKEGRKRIGAPLSISDERLEWAASMVKHNGDEPTDANVARFIRDYCYDMINLAQDVAAYHGYAPDELLQAIANGETATVLLPDEQRGTAIIWLLEQAKQVNDFILSEALESIARQLDAAVQREIEAEQDEEDS